MDVDDDLLSAAQQAAGEKTIKVTVRRALELLVAQSGRREDDLRRRWADLGDGLADPQDEDVMRRAWS